ncbi:hypothetical protein B0H10DRAFT_1971266 [Mycena sp. CBHHK59/15]|nr:hypothetical protein B0H10DRAFT_1971266 [Mycena sp. CBHHK59/15]
MSAGAIHIIAILPDGRYVCDCCMGLNLGLVCRHYFTAWLKMPGLPFHISLIQARWYQDPQLAVADKVAVVPRGPEPTPPTQTIPQHRVYHELQADLRSMMSGIQTQEQLDDLRERLGQIGRDTDDQARRDTLQDPPTISRKGRPLTKRLTGRERDVHRVVVVLEMHLALEVPNDFVRGAINLVIRARGALWREQHRFFRSFLIGVLKFIPQTG